MEDFENIKELKDITDLIRRVPAIQPPDDFTQRFMGRLLEREPSVLSRIQKASIQPMGGMVTSRGVLPAASTRGECAFSYILTGIFYGIIGLILIVGLGDAAGEAALSRWTSIQPPLMIVAALWLSGLGMLLLMNDRMDIKVAKTGTRLYLLFIVLSGSALFLAYRIPVLMASTCIFALSGVVMGVLLHQNISAYQKSLHH